MQRNGRKNAVSVPPESGRLRRARPCKARGQKAGSDQRGDGHADDRRRPPRSGARHPALGRRPARSGRPRSEGRPLAGTPARRRRRRSGCRSRWTVPEAARRAPRNRCGVCAGKASTLRAAPAGADHLDLEPDRRRRVVRCSVETRRDLAKTSWSNSSHLGLGAHPAALYAIADRLAQPEGHWEPFHRNGWRLVYSDPHKRREKHEFPRSFRRPRGARDRDVLIAGLTPTVAHRAARSSREIPDRYGA